MTAQGKKKKKSRRKKRRSRKLKPLDYYIEHELDKAGFTNRHHLSPGGESGRGNILVMDALSHVLWHKLFGNKTLEQVIDLLQRMKKMKGR